MKRISPVGCGYQLVPGVSYTCSGIPAFNTAFGHTPLKTATSSTWLTEIDNYNNVPQSMEGFIMTLVPIIDMSGTQAGISLPEVPELECRVNCDPFVDEEDSVLHTGEGWSSVEETESTGFLDMFHYGPGYEDKVYVVVNGSTHHLHEGQTLTMLPPFSNGVDVYMMKPGLLEPMVDTSFAPISVDVNPPDLDGPNTAISILNKWRHEADLRFRDLYSKVRPWTYDDSNVKGLAGLQNALNKEGPCDNFAITLITGTPLIRLDSGDSHTSPLYSVDAGTIKINGSVVTIPAMEAAVSAPFKAYLDVVGTTASIQTATHIPLSNNGHTHVYIGEVREIKNNQESASQNPLFGDGSILSLYQIIQGDCITEVNTGTGSGRDYEGPFKVSLYSSGVYAIEGSTVTDEVVGGPTVGTVADKTYISYTYTITDASHHIPDTVSTKYAGYSVIDGVNYTPELKYIFSVDSETDATVYMMYTKGDTGWTSEYKVNTGRGTDSIPATDDLIIGSTTSVNISGLTAGDTYVDAGTTYTVESINGREVVVSYTNPTTQAKETAVCEAPQRYVVPIGYVSGSAVGQVQYGDIFLDMQDIEGGSTPPGDLVYTGPFRVSSEYLTDQQIVVKVHGISYDYNLSSTASASEYVKYAGRVVLDGIGVNEVLEAVVQTPQTNHQTSEVTYVTPTTDNAYPYPPGIFDVYAIITLQGTEDSYLFSSCEFIARRSADFSPSSITVADGSIKYWVRLARCYSASTGAIYVEQTHFGDIYVDMQKIKDAVAPSAVSSYNGPFKLGFNWQTKTVVITGTANDTDNHGTYAGRIYWCGKFASWANLPGTVNVGEVFAHVIKSEAGAYRVVYDNAQEYTSSAATDTVYTVRLGKVTATEKDTIPVEVSGTVVNVAVHAIVGTEQSPQANPCVVQLDTTQSTGYRIVAPDTGVTGSIINLYTSADPLYVTVQVDGAGTPITIPLFEAAVDQYHMGDIYIDNDEKTSRYTGPFAIGNTGSITCPDCHSEGTDTAARKPIGYYSINGGPTTAADPGTSGKSVTPSGDVTDVYFTIDPDGWDISTDGCSAPDCYEVYLGWIEGTAPGTGETAWKYKAHQLHYGNIQIDGRWL